MIVLTFGIALFLGFCLAATFLEEKLEALSREARAPRKAPPDPFVEIDREALSSAFSKACRGDRISIDSGRCRLVRGARNPAQEIADEIRFEGK